MRGILYCFTAYGICIRLTGSPVEGVSQQDLVSGAEISPEKMEFSELESLLLFPLCIVRAHPGLMKHLCVELYVRSNEKKSDVSYVRRPFRGGCTCPVCKLQGEQGQCWKWAIPFQSCPVHGAVKGSGVKGAGGGVLWAEALPLQHRAGLVLVTVLCWSQKADILSQGQS